MDGNLLSDIVKDEDKFNITLKHIPGGVMGFELFEVEGDILSIKDFLAYYEIEPESRDEN